MNYEFWNVRVLGDPNKCAIVKETIRESNVVIFCLQETKLNDITLNKFYSFAPTLFHDYALGNADGSRGELLQHGNSYGPLTTPII
jgi:hypothetical protein